MNVGIGYDIHALKKGRKLILGGVQIPHSKGLVGHSDADVLLHSLTDAILGAAGLGDIGEFFPNTDPRYKNADSRIFVEAAIKELKRKKMKLQNVDATLVAEEPKLGPFKDSIRAHVAKLLGIEIENVGLKAKTNEGFGAIGKKQAIACFAVASVKK